MAQVGIKWKGSFHSAPVLCSLSYLWKFSSSQYFALQVCFIFNFFPQVHFLNKCVKYYVIIQVISENLH